MPRKTEEWIGRDDNDAIPPRVRARVFVKFDGRCAICSRTLRFGHWDVDHLLALINGGTHRESNLVPVCNSPCHRNKSKQDLAIKSKNARVRNKHIGVKKKGRKLLGSKGSGYRKKMDGTVVRE